MTSSEDTSAEVPRPIREAIDHYLERRGHGDLGLLARVLEQWESVVGADVARHVQPLTLVDDTLIVEVDRAPWATEMTFLAPRLLEALQVQLGTHVATQIKARVRGRSG